MLLQRSDKRAPEAFAHRVVKGFTRANLADLFAASGYTLGAEIGVADGRNSLTLCQAIPGLRLLCVDPWQKYRQNPRGGPQEQHDRNYELAQERLAAFDVTFVKATSMVAVRNVPMESLDFAYVDGHHSFDWAMQDLIEWSKRVRPGGVVSGHDFYHFKWAGVVEAVDAYTKAHGITDWNLCDEREPSFWWLKP
jgi:hypothetical protein